MSTPQALESYYQSLLYRLLPSMYRGRDDKRELERFVALFGHEAARLRAQIDRLGQDFYIDSCQDWVIPYIADLLDTGIIFNQGARNRADVKNTIKWRRQKGTLAGLEDITSEIGGWGAHAVEMRERLVWSQNLNHRRLQAIHAVDLANGSRLARLRTPFDLSCRSVDFRPANEIAGAYQTGNVTFSVWPVPSQPWVGADPFNGGDGRYFFDPLGRDRILHSGSGSAAATNSDPSSDTPNESPLPHVRHASILARDFQDHPKRYFGAPGGFSVYEDGILLCESAGTVASQSVTPSVAFAELSEFEGLRAANPTIFAESSAQFRIAAIRLRLKTETVNGKEELVVPHVAAKFSSNYEVDESQGALDTAANTYSKGIKFCPPRHQPFLVLEIKSQGGVADFPKCEIIVRNSAGQSMLVYLPAIAGLAADQSVHLYVADDGSTYFASADNPAGEIDLNPDSTSSGAFLWRHLARGSDGQARRAPGSSSQFRQAVYRSLCCWDWPLRNPPKPGEVAFDPERGRFMFPAGEEPAGRLTVAFHFAITGEVGAGPYFQGERPPATATVAKIAKARHRTIQAAVDQTSRPNAGPVIIEILDSHTYAEAVTVNENFSGGLIIRAAPLQMPVVRSPGGPAFKVAGTAKFVTLSGLVIAGGAVDISANTADVGLRFCTLDPATSGIVAAPSGPGLRLDIRNTITGPIAASSDVKTLQLVDSVVQDTGAASAISATHGVSMEHVTVLGAVQAGVLEVSNSILLGPVSVTNADVCCFRYSRHDKELPVRRRFRCTTAFPIFASLRMEHPGYVHVMPTTAAAIRAGAEDGGEMGAFYRAGIPWREQNVRSKLNQYMPAGVRSVPVRVLPLTRFAGMRSR